MTTITEVRKRIDAEAARVKATATNDGMCSLITITPMEWKVLKAALDADKLQPQPELPP